jgi:hypothetical protein
MLVDKWFVYMEFPLSVNLVSMVVSNRCFEICESCQYGGFK